MYIFVNTYKKLNFTYNNIKNIKKLTYINKHFENEVQWGFIKEKNVFLGHKINMVIYIYLKI